MWRENIAFFPIPLRCCMVIELVWNGCSGEELDASCRGLINLVRSEILPGKDRHVQICKSIETSTAKNQRV
mgnify:CR=1 FL=1